VVANTQNADTGAGRATEREKRGSFNFEMMFACSVGNNIGLLNKMYQLQ